MGESFKRLLAGIAYMVWRATTGRPAFVHQADSRQVKILFLVVMLITSLFINLSSTFSDHGLWRAMDTFVVGVLTAMFVCHGIQSRLPLINVLACMVGLSFVEGAFWLACDAIEAFGPAPEADVLVRPWFILFVIGAFKIYMAIQIKKSFLQLPADIQKPGYRPATYESAPK